MDAGVTGPADPADAARVAAQWRTMLALGRLTLLVLVAAVATLAAHHDWTNAAAATYAAGNVVVTLHTAARRRP